MLHSIYRIISRTYTDLMAGTRQSFRPGSACKDAASSMVCLSWQPYTNSTDKTAHAFLATVDCVPFLFEYRYDGLEKRSNRFYLRTNTK